jgi:hypothetical protein
MGTEVWLLLLVLCMPGRPAGAQVQSVRLYLFWQQGCPSCERMDPFLRGLAGSAPEIELIEREVGHTVGDLQALRDATKKFGIKAPYVPAVFLGTRAWIGFSEPIASEIEAEVTRCLEAGCIDALVDPLPAADPKGSGEISAGPFGRIRPGALPLALATGLIGLVDGVNPCSLWVLTFLLGMVVHTESRRKVLLVGSIFLAVTALVYGLFVAGMTQIMRLLAYVGWIRVAVAALSCAMGAINMKDHFAPRKGVSLTISSENRRRIGARTRSLLGAARSLPSLVLSTLLLAAGVAVVELPCTAGFPVVWSNMVSDARVGKAVFLGLLALYLAVYLLDEVVVVVVAALTLKRIGMDERRARFLKLLGGTIMVALGITLLVRPRMMESLAGVGGLFAACALATVLVVLFERLLIRRRRSGAAGDV